MLCNSLSLWVMFLYVARAINIVIGTDMRNGLATASVMEDFTQPVNLTWCIDLATSMCFVTAFACRSYVSLCCTCNQYCDRNWHAKQFGNCECDGGFHTTCKSHLMHWRKYWHLCKKSRRSPTSLVKPCPFCAENRRGGHHILMAVQASEWCPCNEQAAFQ